MGLKKLLTGISIVSVGFLPMLANAQSKKPEGFIFGAATLPSNGIPDHYKTGFGFGGGINVPLGESNLYLRIAGDYSKFKGDKTILEDIKLFRTERTKYEDYMTSYSGEAGLSYAPSKDVYFSGGYGAGQLSDVSGILRTGSRDNIDLQSSRGKRGHGPYGLIGIRARKIYLEFGAKNFKFREGENFSGLFARLGLTFGAE